MQLHCEQPFLECPVSYTARSKRLEFLDGDTLVYDLDIPLDPLHPDYVVYLPIRHLLGRTLTLRTVPEMPLTLRQTAEDEAPRASRLRPQIPLHRQTGLVERSQRLVHGGRDIPSVLPVQPRF